MADAPARIWVDFRMHDCGREHPQACYIGDAMDESDGESLEYVRADIHKAIVAERDGLWAVLVECRDEIDGYIWQEHPDDHPATVRRRERDLSANPARIALGESND